MSLPRVRRLGKLLGTNDSREALHAGAQIYINFMSLTRRSGWLQGHISKQGARDADKAEQARLSLLTAAARHLTFTDLFKHGGGDESLLRGQAVPTRDISVVWAADLLRPHLGAIIDHHEDEDRATAWYDAQHMRLLQSGARFEKATGREWLLFFKEGARTTPALRRFDTDSSGIVTADQRKQALDAWQASYDATAIAFTKRTGTSYRVPAGQMPHEDDLLQLAQQDSIHSWRSFLSSYDATKSEAEKMATAAKLADAVASQASFVGRILALGPRIITDEWIDRAIVRYSDFLQLARDHPGKGPRALVPTLDIDLIWHVHMLSPLDYRDDCYELLGHLLSHDDQKDALELKDAFDATAERWHATHGTPYVWHGTCNEKGGLQRRQQQRQQKKKSDDSRSSSDASYSGCGSCGWGDELFHERLFHTNSEPEQIEEAYLFVSRGEGAEEGHGGLPLEATAFQEPEPWAVDAPRAPPPGADADGDGPSTQLMEDPWAPSASDAADSGSAGSTDSSWGWRSSSSSCDSHSLWGWGGDSSSDGGGCGGGCGGD